MKDMPKLRRKLDHLRILIDNFEKKLDGKGETWESANDFAPDKIMSAAMEIYSESGALVENVTTAWRKTLLDGPSEMQKLAISMIELIERNLADSPKSRCPLCYEPSTNHSQFCLLLRYRKVGAR